MYKEVSPNPSALIFSLRSIGYNPMTAIADIIDNSITAKASRIDIDFKWNNGVPEVKIKDNGCGMNEENLIAAMRIGDKNPLNKRDKNDLGRFSLGLKTASFSQCKRLEVYSKTNKSNMNGKAWDLDHIFNSGKWELESLNNIEVDLENQGTLIIWKIIDKFSLKENDFYLMVEEVENYLSQIFHYYLKNIDININGNKINSWDPFLTSNKFTRPLRTETIGNVKVTGYILPHDSNISEEERKQLHGIKGWGGHQGFYVYRNNRMIINGDWLGLSKKDDHYKLARIKVEIENTEDFQWEIDIKKSKAKIPAELRKPLERIAKKVRKEADELYRYRGKQLSRSVKGSSSSYVWECKKNRGSFKYNVNLENQVIQNFMEENNIGKRKMKNFLSLIEETIPVGTIVSNSEVHKEKPQKPFEGQEEIIKKMIENLYNSMSLNLTEENIKKTMITTEPFSYYPELIESTIEELKYGNG